MVANPAGSIPSNTTLAKPVGREVKVVRDVQRWNPLLVNDWSTNGRPSLALPVGVVRNWPRQLTLQGFGEQAGVREYPLRQCILDTNILPAEFSESHARHRIQLAFRMNHYHISVYWVDFYWIILYTD